MWKKFINWLYHRNKTEQQVVEPDFYKETPEQIAAREKTTYWFLMQVALTLEKQRKAKEQQNSDTPKSV